MLLGTLFFTCHSVAETNIVSGFTLLEPKDLSNEEEIHLSRGRTAIEKENWIEAIREFSVVIHLNPVQTEAYAYRGASYFSSGLFTNAISDFTKLAEIEPTNYQAYCNRGSAYRAEGEYDKAVEDLTTCIKLRPTDDTAYKLRAACYHSLGEARREISDWSEALRYTPRDTRARTMRALAYSRSGQPDKAIADLHSVVQIDETNHVAYNELAWLRATCPITQFRSGKEAIASATKACELEHWKNASYVDTLAAAYAEIGKFATAVKYENQAIAMNEGLEEMRKGMQHRLSLFEQNQPYREDVTQTQKPR